MNKLICLIYIYIQNKQNSCHYNISIRKGHPACAVCFVLTGLAWLPCCVLCATLSADNRLSPALQLIWSLAQVVCLVRRS